MEERWLPVSGYHGFYEVSDHGRVRSLPRTSTRGGILKASPSKQRGHMYVSLCREGKQKSFTVHSLVMKAFVGAPPPCQEIRHLDGDPSNNHLDNLKYGTRGENNLDQVLHGTHPEARKTHCPQNHEYTEENTVRIPSRPNARYCRQCLGDSSLRAYYARRESTPTEG
jgi:hypothetical protein